MDVILYLFFLLLGLMVLIGRSAKIVGPGGRLICFLGMLFEVVGIVILYGESPVVGVTFASLNSSYILPMTQTVGGHAFPLAMDPLFLMVIIDGFAAVGP